MKGSTAGKRIPAYDPNLIGDLDLLKRLAANESVVIYKFEALRKSNGFKCSAISK